MSGYIFVAAGSGFPDSIAFIGVQYISLQPLASISCASSGWPDCSKASLVPLPAAASSNLTIE